MTPGGDGVARLGLRHKATPSLYTRLDLGASHLRRFGVTWEGAYKILDKVVVGVGLPTSLGKVRRSAGATAGLLVKTEWYEAGIAWARQGGVHETTLHGAYNASAQLRWLAFLQNATDAEIEPVVETGLRSRARGRSLTLGARHSLRIADFTWLAAVAEKTRALTLEGVLPLDKEWTFEPRCSWQSSTGGETARGWYALGLAKRFLN